MNDLEVLDEGGSALLSSGDKLVELAENAERRVAAVKKIKLLALSVTNSQDWIDESGRPYLQVSGAEKICNLFNGSWTIEEPEIETELDGHFTYTYKGEFTFFGNKKEVIGSRSSKDSWFSRSKGADISPEKIKKWNVKKAALTNCIGNGITRSLGIRNMTWEELETVGINKMASASVDRTGKDRCAPAFGFGPCEGMAKKPLKDLTIEQLQWYSETLEKYLSDPDKQNLKQVNTKALQMIVEELNSRDKPVEQTTDTPEPTQSEEGTVDLTVFAPGKAVEGKVLAYSQEKTKTGTVVHRLRIAAPAGIDRRHEVEVAAFKSAHHYSEALSGFDELVNRWVVFNVSKGKKYKGKPQYYLEELWLDPSPEPAPNQPTHEKFSISEYQAEPEEKSFKLMGD